MTRLQLSKLALSLGIVLTAALCVNGPSFAAPASPAGLSRINDISAITFVQDKRAPETVKHKVKRLWREFTGYKFDVACPAFAFALSHATCTVNGKDRENARAKCQSQYVLCEIRDENR